MNLSKNYKTAESKLNFEDLINRNNLTLISQPKIIKNDSISSINKPPKSPLQNIRQYLKSP